MTARDRIIIVVVLVAAALGAFWFVGLAPKRKEAADLQGKIAVATKRLNDAQQKAGQARQAKAHYARDYAEVATLGKAVPKSDALPSLIYQLQTAAHGARINFNALKVTASGATAPPPTPAAATAAVAKGSGTTAGSTSSGATPTAATPSASAPATQAASSALPPGAAIGSAGFPTMPFSFVFNGTFFDMERFLRDVQRFVRVDGQSVNVRGRLLSVDGFGLSAGPGGFPNVKVNVSATAYLRSPADDVTPSGSTTTGSGSTSAGGASNSGAPATAPSAGVTQ
jgi:Tfp pilus assembly protein PilO